MTYEASPLMVVRSWYDFRLIEGLVEPRPLTVVIVVLEKATVEVDLLTSSVKSASSMVTLLMCATFILI